jgi:hypothetical protein
VGFSAFENLKDLTQQVEEDLSVEVLGSFFHACDVYETFMQGLHFARA